MVHQWGSIRKHTCTHRRRVGMGVGCHRGSSHHHRLLVPHTIIDLTRHSKFGHQHIGHRTMSRYSIVLLREHKWEQRKVQQYRTSIHLAWCSILLLILHKFLDQHTSGCQHCSSLLLRRIRQGHRTMGGCLGHSSPLLIHKHLDARNREWALSSSQPWWQHILHCTRCHHWPHSKLKWWYRCFQLGSR